MTQEDPETILATLRKFKNARWQVLMEEEATGKITPPASYRVLTDIAQTTLSMATRAAYQAVCEHLEKPKGRYALVAMGKFGGYELTYGSDLDLIFLIEFLEDQEFFVRLGQRIISLMGVITQDGYAYKVDMELRPSGRSGVLVSSLPSFQEYHETMAMLWEHQALIKARPVIGEENFQKTVAQKIHRIVYRQRPASIGSEIKRLRLRMEQELAHERPGQFDVKVGRGGLVDIEFLVQYLQLCHGWNQPALQTTQTLEALSACEGLFLRAEEVSELNRAYFYYRGLESALRQATGQKTSLVIVGSSLIQASLMKALNKEDLVQTRERVRALFERVIHD